MGLGLVLLKEGMFGRDDEMSSASLSTLLGSDRTQTSEIIMKYG